MGAGLGAAFWVATWEEAAVWWHTRAVERHAAALGRLHARHRARVVSWTRAPSAVTTRRLPRPRPAPTDDDLSS